MNDLQVFKNEQFGQVRVIEQDGEPWFVGKDVAEILGYENSSKALIDHVDNDDKLNNVSLSSLGQRGGWLINESGLYSLVMSSKLPQAKAFKRWVTHDVIPSIRKHGAYMTPQKLEEFLLSPDTMIKTLQVLKEEQEKRKAAEHIIEMQKPKVLFSNAVSNSRSTILIRDLAKLLKQNGIDIGQNRLFEWLRQNGYLIRAYGQDYNSPSQKAMDKGLFELKERVVNCKDGSVMINKTTKVTGNGQIYFINKFLGK